MCYNLTGVVYQPPPWVINMVFSFGRRGMRLLRTPWVELRRERDGARMMETVVSYPGVKNCTAQRAMYIERPRVAEKRAYLALKRAFDISGIDVDRISAQYADGVLKLDMPKKSATVSAKQIEIQ